MKKIDFIMAGIVSAVWAIITCIYCGQGGIIDLVNQIDMGNGLYFPLPSRYWDWIFVGLFYIMMASYLRGHWLPNREYTISSTRDEMDVLLFLVTFVITGVIVVKVFIKIPHKTVCEADLPLLLILACIGARTGRLEPPLTITISAIGAIHMIAFGWYFALLATLIILIAKILIWLTVNTFRSGFTTARQQLWMSLVVGQKIVGETGHRNQSNRTNEDDPQKDPLRSPPSQVRTGTQDATIHKSPRPMA